MPAVDIAEYRYQMRLTQKQLAERLGVFPGTITKWEQDQQPIRHPEMLRLALEKLLADYRAEREART